MVLQLPGTLALKSKPQAFLALLQCAAKAYLPSNCYNLWNGQLLAKGDCGSLQTAAYIEGSALDARPSEYVADALSEYPLCCKSACKSYLKASNLSLDVSLAYISSASMGVTWPARMMVMNLQNEGHTRGSILIFARCHGFEAHIPTTLALCYARAVHLTGKLARLNSCQTPDDAVDLESCTEAELRANA